ncbi:multidrug resistance-associated protein 5-like [Copidosoma floridanum]|uniref:multidrug resistance-associated protein 5-like n=1 Tax=Copidosoma floridanum TaxID=29053 RepID=UPI0006C9A0A8|nr:multidrug resistance-associated protein 5-like [Copidosoma floridanum]
MEDIISKKIKEEKTRDYGVDEIMGERTGFFSYVYSSWLTKYLWKAYRKGITIPELPGVSVDDSCAYNIQEVENLWNEEIRRRGPTSASLLMVAWRFVRSRFIVACTLNACAQIVKFILQMYLLGKLLQYSDDKQKSFSNGVHWILYIIVFDLFQMMLYTWSDIMNQRTALRLKSACLCLLFKKVTTINSIRQKNPDELISMLSKDSHRIYDAVNFGTAIVNAPVVVLCLTIYILTWMNPLAIFGLLAFLAFYVVQYWFRHFIDYCEKNAKEWTKTRIESTIEALENIRLIKIFQWEQPFLRNIMNIRKRESKWIWKKTYVKSLLNSLAHAIPIITFTITFYMHFLCEVSRNSIAFKVFPICIVYIVQLHEALEAMKTSLSYLKDSVVTFKRLKGGLLLDDSSCPAMKPYEASQALAIVNGTFVYDVLKNPNLNSDNMNDVTKNMESDQVKPSEEQKLMTNTLERTRLEILSNINFKAKKGQLIGVCGPAGSGKSSLLLATLGQIKMTSGQLLRQGSCAYVAQKAWVANTTIKDNILFDESLNKKRYYEAQIVSKLRQDIKNLPDNEDTEIGNGELDIDEVLKQKIALARAFYADRDVYFLDDPLSCMDDNLSKEIFEDLIIRALAEKTIIMVTNDIEFLDRCDYMYIMRDGKIAEHGKHKELMRLGKEYASMVKTANADVGDYTNEFEEVHAEDIQNGIDQSSNPEKQETSKTANLKIESFTLEVDNNLIKNDGTELKNIKGVTYYTYAKSLGSLFLLLPIILIYLTNASIEVYNLVRLTWWIKAIDTREIYNESTSTYYERWCSVSLLLLVLGCTIQSFVAQFAITRITNNMHDSLLTKIIHAPARFFHSKDYHVMKSHFMNDLNFVSTELPTKLDNTLRYTAIIFFAFFVMLSTIPWFTNYVVLTIVFFLYVGKIYRAAQINFKLLEHKIRLEINNFLQNSIEGLSTIRIFKKENDLMSKFQDLVDLNSACCFIRGVSKSWLSSRLEVLTASCIFVASFFTISLQEHTSPVLFGLTFVYIFQVPHIIKMGINYLLKTEQCFTNVQNICDYLAALQYGDDDKTTTPTLNTEEWLPAGHVQFEDVVIRPRLDEPPIIDHLSFQVKKGEKCGILTKTKAERNAIVAAIYGLYKLNNGQITIDCTDVRIIGLKRLTSQVFFVPENPTFYGTVRCFLDSKNCYDDAEIWSVLEKLHLKDVISKVASQLDCSFAKSMFNAVEKQLLFFARAYLSQCKVILMEENSSTDHQSTALIQEVIEKQFEGCTVLVFAQRPRFVLSCHSVLIVENGRMLGNDYTSTFLEQEESHFKKWMVEDELDRSRF